jgi:Cu2+-exporting ATPase
MTATFEHARPSACPACNAAPAAEHLAELPKDATLMLSLPGIHCAGCISGVEKVLNAVPGVRSARVNLTLRRAAVEAGPEVTADDLTAVLDRAGYEAHELDAGVLATTEADRQGKDLLMRLAVAFFAMMNVMLLSVAVWSGAEGFTRDMMHWISAAIASRRSFSRVGPSTSRPGARSGAGGSTWTCRSRWRSGWRWARRCTKR